MLDAKARVGDWTLGHRHRRERLFVLVEHLAISAVADGMRLDLDAAAQGGGCNAQDLAGRRDVQSATVRRVAVRRLECRAAAAKCTVHEELDSANGEARVA